MKQYVDKNSILYLREETGAGIMYCKNALIEARGDLQEAAAILRTKGYKAAEQKADRNAADGIAYAGVYDNKAVLVEVNTETDFVAGNSQFINHVEKIAQTAARFSPQDVETLTHCPTDVQGLTVEELLQKMTLTFGEKIVLRRFSLLEGERLTAYMHLKGRYGVILDLAVTGNFGESQIRYVGKELGMQIAAMAPLYISRAHISDETREGINAAIVKQVQEDGSLVNKPQQVVAKIVTGRIEKYYRSKCLMDQPYIRDDNATVQQFLQATNAKQGFKIQVRAFCRYERAEGLQNDDFANTELAPQNLD